jgi:hypothetical protein
MASARPSSGSTCRPPRRRAADARCSTAVSSRCAISPRRIAPASRAPPLKVCSVRMQADGASASDGWRSQSRRRDCSWGSSSSASSSKIGNSSCVDGVDGLDVLVVVEGVARAARGSVGAAAQRIEGVEARGRRQHRHRGGRSAASAVLEAGGSARQARPRPTPAGARSRSDGPAGPATSASGSRRQTGAAGGGSLRRRRHEQRGSSAEPGPSAAERISACSSARARLDSSA